MKVLNSHDYLFLRYWDMIGDHVVEKKIPTFENWSKFYEEKNFHKKPW